MGFCGVKMDKIRIDKVVIFGAGRMGSTIAIAMAQAGIKVVVVSRKDKNKVFSLVVPRLIKSIEKKELTIKNKSKILENISGTVKVNVSADADLVLDAITENFEEKKKLFKQLNLICAPKTIFATNTSALSVERLSLISNRPNQFIGMHFFNPADKMKLVEIIRTKTVSESVVRRIKEIVKKINKEFIVIEDIPGFIVNRLFFPMLNEAVNLVEEKVASPGDVDRAMFFGANFPMGPLALADLIGLDICLAILESLYKRTEDKKYAPSSLLLKKVRSGQLGKKTHRGFYSY